MGGIDISTTIKDVARHTGLSISTISKYLNGGNVLPDNRRNIEAAIHELGFKVNEIARGLKTSRTMTVGVLIPSLENIFFTSIVSNIENVLLNNRYGVILCDYRQDKRLEIEKLNFLVDKMVDGIVMVPQGVSNEHIMPVVKAGIPLVFIDRVIKGIDCDAVLADNAEASFKAVEQLIIRGHRRIGIICGPREIFTTEERLRGYIAAFEHYGLMVDRDLIKFGNYQVDGGHRLLLELLDSDSAPTAVFVTNYEMTLGAIMAVNERNIRIPRDLSLIGFDNLEMARIVKPSLSIVAQPIQQIGETAARILLDRIKNGPGSPQVHRLKADVLINESLSYISREES